MDDRAGIAASRLAIIDLHERSNQPLHHRGLHLVFNGELYNYKELRDELRGLGHAFQTEGDAEVVLHAWAEWNDEALDRFNGMFAFAIWDENEGTLWLASDPFGEKPLYLVRSGGRLVFASEIKALLRCEDAPSRVNHSAVAAFVARGIMPVPPESFLADCMRLPPAHVLRWRDGATELRRYWTPQPVDVPVAYPDAVAELRGLLKDSVRLRLRSDVPVGTSLSGGIDSSTILMLSAELAGDHTRHAFTASFPGFERDEWSHAREVAQRAGVVEHHAVEPTADEALRDVDRLVLDHEEPIGSLSVYAQWRVMSAAREAGVTVLLDGQGGDELFGGYRFTPGFAVRARGVRRALQEVTAGRARAAVVARSLAADRLPGPARRAYWRRTSSPYAAGSAVCQAAEIDRRSDQPWIASKDPLRRELLTESFETSLPELLRYADRSSMAHSREVRLPFLDRRVAELAFSLPPQFLYSNGHTKRILRDVGRGLVPGSVLSRREKIAYEPPQKAWLEHPDLRRRIADTLLDDVARVRGLYDMAAIERDVREGTWRDSAAIWRAFNAELWLQLLSLR